MIIKTLQIIPMFFKCTSLRSFAPPSEMTIMIVSNPSTYPFQVNLLINSLLQVALPQMLIIVIVKLVFFYQINAALVI